MLLKKTIVLASTFAIAFGADCMAQSSPPARIGNVWGGAKHQPTRNEVRTAEIKRHTSLNAQQKASEDKELGEIKLQLSRPD